jgi:hypothetical protein
LEGLGKLKKKVDIIGIRPRGLSAGSIPPQPTKSPHDLRYFNTEAKSFIRVQVALLYKEMSLSMDSSIARSYALIT